jgi:hypothetical protein
MTGLPGLGFAGLAVWSCLVSLRLRAHGLRAVAAVPALIVLWGYAAWVVTR